MAVTKIQQRGRLAPSPFIIIYFAGDGALDVPYNFILYKKEVTLDRLAFALTIKGYFMEFLISNIIG